MLRLLLPPNLPIAATRDAIAVRLELDLSAPPPPGLTPGLAVLQRIGAKPERVSFLQLTRAQLAELTEALAGQPVFFWANQPAQPIAWNGRDLVDVGRHLVGGPVPAAKIESVSSSRPAARKAASAPPPRPMMVDGSEHFLAITLPARESPDHLTAWELLKQHGFVLEPSNGKFWLRDRHKTLNFLAAHGRDLRERFHATFTENFQKNTGHIRLAEIAAATVAAGNDYEVTLSLDAGAATEAEIMRAVETSCRYVQSGKEIRLVEPAVLARLQSAHRTLAGSPEVPGTLHRRHRIARARVAEVDEILAKTAPHFQPPVEWRERSAALRLRSALPPAPVPEATAAVLRPYQQLGVAWMWYLLGQKLGGILADEMGLGKTLQALALLSAWHRDRGAPSLVVCPASLMENWRREAARFTPGLRVLVHHGDRRDATGARFADHDLVITSYGTLARDEAAFAAVEFGLILGDEAQHLKNRRTQAARSLRQLRGRGRFLLTGTPLENSLEDLRSLFEFLMPGFIPAPPPGLRAEERSWYDGRLRAQTAAFILRRTKAGVAPELPEKIEQVIYCEPGPGQLAVYRQYQDEGARELDRLAAGGASEGRLRLAALTELLRLRQICCDPRLVRQSADGEVESAKLEAFRELLAECVDEGHRMLVFSQFTSLLDLLRTELDGQGVGYCHLDGSLSPRGRQQAVDRFQSDASIPVFLISLKAGGTGLNLTGADVVVHYDPWWNPAAEAQATDRAHRIGQTKVVTSYRLICSGTVEEKVLALQETKRALLADVFEASDEAAGKLVLEDLRDLLR